LYVFSLSVIYELIAFFYDIITIFSLQFISRYLLSHITVYIPFRSKSNIPIDKKKYQESFSVSPGIYRICLSKQSPDENETLIKIYIAPPDFEDLEKAPYIFTHSLMDDSYDKIVIVYPHVENDHVMDLGVRGHARARGASSASLSDYDVVESLMGMRMNITIVLVNVEAMEMEYPQRYHLNIYRGMCLI